MSSDEDDLINEFRKRFLDGFGSDSSDSAKYSSDSDDFLKPPPIPYEQLIENLVEIKQPAENKKINKSVKPIISVENPVLTPCNVANTLKNLIKKKRCHVCKQYDRKHYKRSHHFHNVAKWISEELHKTNEPDFDTKFIFCQVCNMALSGLKEDSHYLGDSHKQKQQNFCTDCVRVLQERTMAEHQQSINHLKNSRSDISDNNVESSSKIPFSLENNDNCQLLDTKLDNIVESSSKQPFLLKTNDNCQLLNTKLDNNVKSDLKMPFLLNTNENCQLLDTQLDDNIASSSKILMPLEANDNCQLLHTKLDSNVKSSLKIPISLNTNENCQLLDTKLNNNVEPIVKIPILLKTNENCQLLDTKLSQDVMSSSMPKQTKKHKPSPIKNSSTNMPQLAKSERGSDIKPQVWEEPCAHGLDSFSSSIKCGDKASKDLLTPRDVPKPFIQLHKADSKNGQSTDKNLESSARELNPILWSSDKGVEEVCQKLLTECDRSQLSVKSYKTKSKTGRSKDINLESSACALDPFLSKINCEKSVDEAFEDILRQCHVPERFVKSYKTDGENPGQSTDVNCEENIGGAKRKKPKVKKEKAVKEIDNTVKTRNEKDGPTDDTFCSQVFIHGCQVDFARHLVNILKPRRCMLCEENVVSSSRKSKTNHYRTKAHLTSVLTHLKLVSPKFEFAFDNTILVFCVPCHEIFAVLNDALYHYSSENHERLMSRFCDVCLIFDNSPKHKEHKTKFDQFISHDGYARNSDLKFKIVKLHYYQEVRKETFMAFGVSCDICKGKKKHKDFPDFLNTAPQKRLFKDNTVEELREKEKDLGELLELLKSMENAPNIKGEHVEHRKVKSSDLEENDKEDRD